MKLTPSDHDLVLILFNSKRKKLKQLCPYNLSDVPPACEQFQLGTFCSFTSLDTSGRLYWMWPSSFFFTQMHIGIKTDMYLISTHRVRNPPQSGDWLEWLHPLHGSSCSGQLETTDRKEMDHYELIWLYRSLHTSEGNLSKKKHFKTLWNNRGNACTVIPMESRMLL